MLVGETQRPPRSVWPTAIWGAGLVSVLVAVVTLVLGADLWLPTVLGGFAALAFALAVWLSRVDARRRAFVVNFATASLRLDFVTPIAGHARTLVVPFDAVKGLAFFEQADGAECLTVDFVPSEGSVDVLEIAGHASIRGEQHSSPLHDAAVVRFRQVKIPGDGQYFYRRVAPSPGRSTARSPTCFSSGAAAARHVLMSDLERDHAMLRRLLILVVLTLGLPSSAYQLRRDSGGTVVRWKGHVEFVLDPSVAIQLKAPKTEAAARAALATLAEVIPTSSCRSIW